MDKFPSINFPHILYSDYLNENRYCVAKIFLPCPQNKALTLSSGRKPLSPWNIVTDKSNFVCLGPLGQLSWLAILHMYSHIGKGQLKALNVVLFWTLA